MVNLFLYLVLSTLCVSGVVIYKQTASEILRFIVARAVCKWLLLLCAPAKVDLLLHVGGADDSQ